MTWLEAGVSVVQLIVASVGSIGFTVTSDMAGADGVEVDVDVALEPLKVSVLDAWLPVDEALAAASAGIMTVVVPCVAGFRSKV